MTVHIASLFALEKKHAAQALKDLKAFVAAEKKPAKVVLHPDRVLAARDLKSALEAAGFVVRDDGRGRITGLHWGAKPLPSDAKTLRRLVGSLAKWARDPSVMIVRDVDGRTLDITLKKKKVTSNFYEGTEIRKIYELACKAVRRNRDWARALELFTWLTDVEPMSTPGYDRLHDNYRESLDEMPELLARFGRIPEALAACAKHVQPNTIYFSVYQLLDEELKRPADAKRWLELPLKTEPQHHGALWLSFDRARTRDDYAETVTVLRRMTKADRDDQAWSESWALYSLARYDEALKVAKARAAKPDADGDHHERVGDIADAMGRAGEATAAWERALGLFDAKQAGASGAELLLKLGRVPEARAALDLALKADQPHPYTVNHALGLVRLAEGDTAGAVKALETAVKAAPTYERARFDLACALARDGKLKRAKVEAKAAAKMSKDVMRRLKREPWFRA